MDYSSILDTHSQVVRDASLEETRFIFEDPHQPWRSRHRMLQQELDEITISNDYDDSF
jgi:hypothetical protein